MKNTVKHLLTAMSLCGILAACQTLDIPPKNILNGSDIYSEAGITAYMAGLYNHIPMEDFGMGDDGGRGGFYNWYPAKTTLGSTGEFANNECGNSIVYGDKGYWKPAYQLIRQANVLIEDLPNYIGKLNGTEEWIAEARFIRAYTYYALVKRYGGVPLIDHPQAASEDLLVARAGHKECVDFIIEDLKYASENMTRNKVNGRANRYVASAVLARVALYAGSVARYGGDFMHYSADGQTLLCGIPAADANGYFKVAYDAAKAVEEGGYRLMTGANKEQNFRDVFDKATSSPESVFIREYDINNYVHSWNTVMAPSLWTSTYGGRYFVPWDWCELFDGIPLDPATGYAKFTDENGYYIVYDSQHGIYDTMEPRLRASILVPGSKMFGGKTLDMRCGLIVGGVTPDQKILKTTKDDGKTTYSWDNGVKEFKVDGKVVAVRSTKNPKEGETYTGTNIAIAGFNGPSTSGNNACNTGVHGGKWYDLSQPLPGALHKDTHPWIDIRYAEVLLMRAEAAVELAQNGGDASLVNDAFACINQIRDRAGANLLESPSQLADKTAPTNVRGTGQYSWVFAPTKGLQLVRVERYKELAVEFKLFWDLRRWFTADTQMREFRWRMVAPYLFLSTATRDEETGIPQGKYIFDTRVCDSYGGQHTFDSKYYYERIPDSERSVNHLLEQNARY